MPYKDKEKQREYQRGREARHREWMTSLKIGIPCADCGMKFPSECMDWDHIKGTKRRAVAKIRGNSQKYILEEIKKCELICSNCHRIRTKLARVAQE